MRILETTLARWADPTTPEPERWQAVADLAELVRRHADFGNHPPYTFHDRALANLPPRLDPPALGQVARAAGRVLLDPTAAEPLRAAAAFVLGRTRQKSGLQPIVTLICGADDLPPDLVRQCGFAFDALGVGSNLALLGIDPNRVGDHFERRGVPWDRASGRVDVTQL